MKKSRAGFTLLETLLGLVIFAILASSLYGVFASAWQIQKRSQGLSRIHREASWAMDMLARDLENMAGYDFTGSYPRQLAFTADAGKITFLTVTDKGLRFVSYRVETPQATKVHQVVLAEKTKKNVALKLGDENAGVKTAFLVREETGFAAYLQEAATGAPGDIEILSSRISQDGLKFQFAFEPQEPEADYEWRPVWGQDHIPLGVRVEMAFVLSDKARSQLKFKRDIHVPAGKLGSDTKK